MYAYFYIDKDDNLVECDRDTYKEWEFSLEKKWDDISFFYIKDRKVCVGCPNDEIYDRLEDRYGGGIDVMDSEFSVKDKDYIMLTSVCGSRCIEDGDDSHRGFYDYYPDDYYPVFSTYVVCRSNRDYAGELHKLIDCPNYGLEKAIEYHESIILDIVSGKELKYIL